MVPYAGKLGNDVKVVVVCGNCMAEHAIGRIKDLCCLKGVKKLQKHIQLAKCSRYVPIVNNVPDEVAMDCSIIDEDDGVPEHVVPDEPVDVSPTILWWPPTAHLPPPAPYG